MQSSTLLTNLRQIKHGFLALGEIPPTGFIRCHQVHGDQIVFIDSGDASHWASVKADGLLTDQAHVVAIQTADCLPVLMADDRGKVVAAVHAGWRGLHKGILLRAVEEFERRGIPPKNLNIGVGPAIGPCCFEVSNDVSAAFENDWGGLWKNLPQHPVFKSQPKSAHAADLQAKPSGDCRWLDLDAIARLQLMSKGIGNQKIEDVGGCTYCGGIAANLASYRRATHQSLTQAGRQWSFIGKYPG